MKIFLTGATGFVGHHVAKALAGEGAALRLLVRKSSNLKNLKGIAGDTVVGDLAEPDSLKSAMAGADAVVHVAADYRLWIPDPAAMYKANVEGTHELLRMAREAGVRRVVYTSSVATMHFRSDGIVINEDTPVSLRRHGGPLQALQVYGRAGSNLRRAKWSAGHDSESDEPYRFE